jgi:hypothetical protein
MRQHMKRCEQSAGSSEGPSRSSQLCGEMGDDSPIVFVSCCEVQEVAFFPDHVGEEVTALRERVRSVVAKLLFLSWEGCE